MIAISGAGSTIAQRLMILIDKPHFCFDMEDNVPLGADRFVFTAGLLHGEKIHHMTDEVIADTFRVNCWRVMEACCKILEANPVARICVVGSESGIRGSYDEAYAAAKAGLHHYVRTKKVKQHQQLVCVAPGIIEDSGMTMRRTDQNRLKELRKAHPKGRFVQAVEVARLIQFLLYEDLGYISNTVVEITGRP